jgi:hypothetical protein
MQKWGEVILKSSSQEPLSQNRKKNPLIPLEKQILLCGDKM